MHTRFLIHALLLIMLPAGNLAAESADTESANSELVKVYRDPNCSCCHRWIEHLRRNGYQVKDHQTGRLNLIKQELNIPARLASCHTATVDGYIIEGHVPASDISRLLNERPDIRGLSVPGMPIGSPGMEMGDRSDTYSVIGFDADQQTSVFQHYPAQ